MRLQITKLLKGGSFSVSFHTAGFTREEREKIVEFGMPLVDLHRIGLPPCRLDQINFLVRCGTRQEAEETIRAVKQEVKGELRQLLTQPAGPFSLPKVRNPIRGKVLVAGLACALVFLVLTAYKGVISSQQIAKQQVSGPQLAEIDQKAGMAEEKLASPTVDRESSASLTALLETDRSDKEMFLSSAGMVPGSAGQGYRALGKPDFKLTVIPQTLTRYTQWEAGAVQSEEGSGQRHFKIVLTPLGDFKGPIALGLSGSSPLFEKRLYPAKVESLPGSATLIISLPPRSLPQICPEMTVIARGKAPDGTLVTHERKLRVAIHQKSSYRGPVWHVAPQGSDLSGDGSWGSPFRSIQRAVDLADGGDTVLVDKGLYLENISVTNKERVVVASYYIFDEDESIIRSTIIEAAHPGWVVTIGRSDDVTLRGFTIQKGKGKNGILGGGVYCFESSANILDNVVTENQNRSGYGAGIYCYGSQPSILRNQITKNSNYDGHGAGIYCYKSDPVVQQNTIRGNHASGGGSAIHLLEPTFVTISRNVIHHHSGPSSVVLYNKGSVGEFHIDNNTISHNQGDAVRFFGGNWSFESNVITENEGYGMFTLEGTANLSHNNVWNNIRGDDTLDYYGLGGNPTGTNGNISANPSFGNPPHGNFHLCFNSPCIDAGDPSVSVPAGGGSRADIGALEYTRPDLICGDVNRDGYLDYGDIDCLAGYLSGRIDFPVPIEAGDVNLDEVIDKSDLAHLYESLYYYGPEPCGQRKPKDRLTSK